MTALAILVLFQVATVTPTPTPVATPTPTPTLKKTPVAATPWSFGRSLSDVARERKLQQQKGEDAPKARGFTVAPAAGGIGGAVNPATTPAAASEAGTAAGPGPLVLVESAQHNEIVGSNGQVRVFGTVRNAGAAPACDVVLTVRLYDEKDRYLVSGGGRIDEPLLPPGGSSSFSVYVQVPPGVAGSGKQKSLGYGTTGGGVTLEGSWRTLGRAEAEVAAVADACPGEKRVENPAPREDAAPAEKPTVPPR